MSNFLSIIPAVTISSNGPQSKSSVEERYKKVESEVNAILKKYGTAKNQATLFNPATQIKRFKDLYNPLIEKYKKEPANREKTLTELEKLSDELFDALPRSPYMRELTRRNRLDNDAEHKIVLEETAKRRKVGEEIKRKAANVQAEWDKVPALEMRYRIIKSNGQGLDATIKDSAKDLLKNYNLLYNMLVYVHPSGETKTLVQQIDLHLQRGNLEPETKDLLKKLKSKLQPASSSKSEEVAKKSSLEEKLIDEDLRNQSLIKFLEVENSVNQYDDLKKIYQDLVEILKSKNESLELLSDLHRNLYKVYEASDRNASKKHVAESILRTLSPIYLKYLSPSSKKVLDLSKSGSTKYPDKHSFFAATTQESISPMGMPRIPIDLKAESKYFDNGYKGVMFGSGFTKKLAQAISNGEGSIEDALLTVENSYKGTPEMPTAPTHRLSSYSTKNELNDFGVLFITGSEQVQGESKSMILDRSMLEHAIKNKYSERCKVITARDEPTPKDLEETLSKLAKDLKGKKLYIFFHGHGNSLGPQAGVSSANADKQGSKVFSFFLKTYGPSLTEDKIKELYNKYLSDIEVVTIFDTCQSGAGITAIDNKDFKRQLDCLA